MKLFSKTACRNKKRKASSPYSAENFRLYGFKNRIMDIYKTPSSSLSCGTCGVEKIGSFISNPKMNSSIRFTGFFCLNIPITDMGLV